MNSRLIDEQTHAQSEIANGIPAGQELHWVLAAKSGDRTAFGHLAQCYQRRCAGVALRLVGDVHDASEIVQEALISAYRNIGQLHDPERFAFWLMRIVTNVSLNHRRSRARRRTTSIEQGIHGDGDVLAANISAGRLDAPDRPLASAELGLAIRRSIDALPDKQRLALVMFAIEKMPQKDVAEVLNCSVEAVKWHVHMARKQLKKSLANHI